jgi:hypothetical protein
MSVTKKKTMSKDAATTDTKDAMIFVLRETEFFIREKSDMGGWTCNTRLGIAIPEQSGGLILLLRKQG